jgi:Mg2+/Co2+ transporter CorC
MEHKVSTGGSGDTDSIQDVLKSTVDDLWNEYDKDSNGKLDKAEMKAFVMDTLVELDDKNEFSDKKFEAFFK